MAVAPVRSSVPDKANRVPGSPLKMEAVKVPKVPSSSSLQVRVAKDVPV